MVAQNKPPSRRLTVIRRRAEVYPKHLTLLVPWTSPLLVCFSGTTTSLAEIYHQYPKITTQVHRCVLNKTFLPIVVVPFVASDKVVPQPHTHSTRDHQFTEHPNRPLLVRWDFFYPGSMLARHPKE